MTWEVDICSDAEKKLKKFSKKWSHEVTNCLDNLDTLHKSLNDGVKPEQLKKFGFVHAEPKGILALTENGPGKGTRMKALRLYVFPSEETRKLYVITLGDKGNGQSSDIQQCERFVVELQ